MRAFLLTRTTMTSIFGFRASIWSSHDPAGAPRIEACIMTALAPMVRSRRSVRSPILVIAPSFCCRRSIAVGASDPAKRRSDDRS